MKYYIICSFFLVNLFSAFSQSPSELISMIKESQAKINSASYKVQRVDTFVTGQTRINSGIVKIKILAADSIFGFAYWGRRDGVDWETVYDGKRLFQLDHKQKEYEVSADKFRIEHSTGSPGGQMLVPDFARLDTSDILEYTVRADAENYYLTGKLPDIPEYNVEKRVKTFTIDRQLLLPVAVRSRQETLGKVQDIYFVVEEVKLNDPAMSYDFAAEQVPAAYKPKQYEPNKVLRSLVGKAMPAFVIPDFENENIKSTSLKGKVVLLDFWEVWCGPCIASMPKVQELHKKYQSKGFTVYGMMSEKDQLDAARRLVSKQRIEFHMLQSNPELNSSFGIQAVPTYILIDRNGIIQFTSEGFSENISNEIEKLLSK